MSILDDIKAARSNKPLTVKDQLVEEHKKRRLSALMTPPPIAEKPDFVKTPIGPERELTVAEYNQLASNKSDKPKYEKDLSLQPTVRATVEPTPVPHDTGVSTVTSKPMAITSGLRPRIKGPLDVSGRMPTATTHSYTGEVDSRYNVFGGISDAAREATSLYTRTKASFANLLEDPDPEENFDWKDVAREEDEALNKANQLRPGGKEKVLPRIPFLLPSGMTRQSIRDAGASAGFSITSMGASLAGKIAGKVVGAGAGAMFGQPAIGGKVGEKVGQLYGGYKAAHAMDKTMITQQVLDAHAMELGRPLTAAEREHVLNKTEEFRNNHAMWEAIPETVGNMAELSALGKIFKAALGNKVGTRVVLNVLGALGVELGTETITQMGQQRAEVDLGLIDEPKRQWDVPQDWAKSYEEIAASTLLLVGGMSATSAAAGKAFQLAVTPGPANDDEAGKLMDDVGPDEPPGPNAQPLYKAMAHNMLMNELRAKNYTDKQLDAIMASPKALAKYNLQVSDIFALKVERNTDEAMLQNVRDAIDAAPDELTKLGILGTLQGEFLKRKEEAAGADKDVVAKPVGKETPKKETPKKAEPVPEEELKSEPVEVETPAYEKELEGKDLEYVFNRIQQVEKRVKKYTDMLNNEGAIGNYAKANKIKHEAAREEIANKLMENDQRLTAYKEKARIVPKEPVAETEAEVEAEVEAEPVTKRLSEAVNRLTEYEKIDLESVTPESAREEYKKAIDADKYTIKSLSERLNKEYNIPTLNDIDDTNKPEHMVSFVEGREAFERFQKANKKQPDKMPTTQEAYKLDAEEIRKKDVYKSLAYRIGWVQAEGEALKHDDMFVQGRMDFIRNNRSSTKSYYKINDIVKQYGKDSVEAEQYRAGWQHEFDLVATAKEKAAAIAKDIAKKATQPPEELEPEPSVTEETTVTEKTKEPTALESLRDERVATEASIAQWEKALTGDAKVDKSTKKILGDKRKRLAEVNEGIKKLQPKKLNELESKERILKNQIRSREKKLIENPEPIDNIVLNNIKKKLAEVQKEIKYFDDLYGEEDTSTSTPEEKPKVTKAKEALEAKIAENKEALKKVKKAIKRYNKDFDNLSPTRKKRLAEKLRQQNDIEAELARLQGQKTFPGFTEEELSPEAKEVDNVIKEMDTSKTKKKAKKPDEGRRQKLQAIIKKLYGEGTLDIPVYMGALDLLANDQFEAVEELLKNFKDDGTLAARKKQSKEDSDYDDDVGVEVSTVTADVVNLIKLQGANMYRNALAEAAVKELVQNSYDAIKATDNKKGRIDIIVNSDKRLIAVRDNGGGMTRRVINKAFLVIGGSDKTGIKAGDASGGFGMAKMLVFSQDKLWLKTIKNGKLNEIEIDIQDLLSEGARFTPKPSEGNSGTTIILQVPEKVMVEGEERTVWFPTGEKGTEFLQRPLLDPNVEINYLVDYSYSNTVEDYLDNSSEFWAKGGGFDKNAKTLPIGKNQDLSGYSKPREVSFKWGKADVYIGLKRKNPDSWPGPRHRILSAGVYQFNHGFNIMRFDKVPYDILVNFKPTVEAKSDLYPFNLKREGFKDTNQIEKDIKGLSQYVASIALGIDADETVKAFKTIKAMPKVDIESAAGPVDISNFILTKPNKNIKNIKDKTPDKIKIKDGVVYYTEGGKDVILYEEKKTEKEATSSFKAKEKLKEAKDYLMDMGIDDSQPIFHNNTTGDFERGAQLWSELGSLFLQVRDEFFRQYPDKKVEGQSYFTGVSIDKGYKGVNVPIPFKGAFVNPLAIWEPTLPAVAYEMYDTLVHELAHEGYRNHEDSFVVRNHQLGSRLASTGFDIETRVKLARILKRHQKIYNEMKEEYETSSTKNVGESLQEGKGGGELLAKEIGAGSIDSQTINDQLYAYKRYLEWKAGRRGERKGLQRDARRSNKPLKARSTSVLGLNKDQAAEELLSVLNLKKIPKRLIIVNENEIPAQALEDLKNGKAEAAYKPKFRSTLIDKYIMKGLNKGDAAAWLRQLQDWTQPKEKFRTNKDTGERESYLKQPTTEAGVIQDIEFSGLKEFIEDHEGITITRDEVIDYLKSKSFVGQFKRWQKGGRGDIEDAFDIKQHAQRRMERVFENLEEDFDIKFDETQVLYIIESLLDTENYNDAYTTIIQEGEASDNPLIQKDSIKPWKIINYYRYYTPERLADDNNEISEDLDENTEYGMEVVPNFHQDVIMWLERYLTEERDKYRENLLNNTFENQHVGNYVKLAGAYEYYRNNTIKYDGRISHKWYVTGYNRENVKKLGKGKIIEPDTFKGDYDTLEGATNVMRALEKKHPEQDFYVNTTLTNDANETYHGSPNHFPGAVIHLRASIRRALVKTETGYKDVVGDEVFFIEEIQSDWNQQADAKGRRYLTKQQHKEIVKAARKDFNKAMKEHFSKPPQYFVQALWDGLYGVAKEYALAEKKNPTLNPVNNFALHERIFYQTKAKLSKIAYEQVDYKRGGPATIRIQATKLLRNYDKTGDFTYDQELMSKLHALLPGLINEVYERKKISNAPLKNTWEMVGFKEMLMQAYKEGVRTVAWHRYNEQVKQAQNWNDAQFERYQHIANRYTVDLVKKVNKFAKPYGLQVEPLELITVPDSRGTLTTVEVNGLKINDKLAADIEKGLYIPSANDGGIQALYHNGNIYFVADNIDNVEEIKGLMVHEGGHFLRRHDPWFQKKYNEILDWFSDLGTGDSLEALEVAMAYNRVPFTRSKDLRNEEALMYYLQDAVNNGTDKAGVLDRLISLFKRWLFKYFGVSPKKLNITPQEMGEIVLKEARARVQDVQTSEVERVSEILYSKKGKSKESQEILDKLDKEAAKILKNALGTPESYQNTLDVLKYEGLTNTEKAFISLKDGIVKRNIEGFKRDKTTQSTSWWDRIVSSPEYYFLKDDTAAKVFKHGQDKGDNRYQWENKIAGESLKTIARIYKKNRAAYNKANKYLVEADKTGKGFSMRWHDEEKQWMILNRNNKPIKYVIDEQEAVAYMLHAEQVYLRSRWFNNDARLAILRFRELTNRGFDMSIQDFRRQIKDAEDNDQPMPEITFIDDDNNKETITLEAAIATMGDLRGTYFPRERPNSDFVLRATKEGAENKLLTFSWYFPQNKERGPVSNWIKDLINSNLPIGREVHKLERAGYTIQSIEPVSTPSNMVFDVPGLLSSLQQILDSAAENAESKTLLERDKLLIREMNGMLTLRIADVYKAKGTFSSRLKRSKTTWEGYEEDMLKAATGYSQRVAVGKATRETARKMLLTMTGREVSWPDWKRAHPDKNYKDYVAEVRTKAIDSKNQKKLYEDLRQYITHVLRPDDPVDRIIGYFKAAAVFKFLGFRVASAAINMTNMFLAVPATITGHAGISLSKSIAYINAASAKYTLYRLEQLALTKTVSKQFQYFVAKNAKSEILTADDRQIFAAISEKGWDEAQFNHEAARAITDRFGTVVNTSMAGAMYLFGATEKANRAITIFAAYQALKAKNPNDSTSVLLDAARHTSDRAHGVYGSIAKPWLIQRVKALDLPYTFMKFQHNYMLNALDLFYKHKSVRGGLYQLLSAGAMAGVEASILLKLAFFLWGLAFDKEQPEEQFYQAIEDKYGMDSAASRLARHGIVGALTGVNLRGSLEMNMQAPSKVSEIGGAPASIVTELGGVYKHTMRKEYWKAFEDAMPTAVGSLAKGFREYHYGVTTSSNAPVYYGDTQLKADIFDVAKRALSFNPSFISAAREKQWREDEMRRIYTGYRSDIKADLVHWAEAGGSDDKWYADIWNNIDEYNTKVFNADPKYRLTIITGDWIDRQINEAFAPDVYEQYRRN